MEKTVSQIDIMENSGAQQYVTFSLNDENYAIEALNVQEILELTRVTKVPHLPDHFRGVINLRGMIIPVVDLKVKFGMKGGDYGKHTCIIVIEYGGGEMGIIVDTVSDVMHLAPENISATPSFGDSIDTEFLRGMGRSGDELILILDIEKVLTEADRIHLRAARDIAGQSDNNNETSAAAAQTEQ